ncbi:helix-turn-helix domain-containing protein [Lentibacter sp. XHP0401]|jgi:DNA-binding MarR family transcriptional regulator|uniref:helix-turn-helix domain-containing protein n=1 Tax=Lentibacter sp. XHP0401 TaxID=2984334 RepID=UPI0021E9AB1B|nr:helix-turn-helix domain-containing protein [Lentibacter sp. XHP0401]MCV2892728.1 helix-turn-helix domain-containing protein [Lentibacter sp. XHP0401]
MVNDEEESNQQSAAIRTVVQAQIIECLNRFYAMETGMWGKPVDCLIIRTVVQGKLQGKLYDLSALSEVLGLPISTLHRKIGTLVESGFLRREPRGKSIYISSTDNTNIALDQSFETMVATLRSLYKGEIDLDKN